MGTRICIITWERSFQIGPPLEVYRRPRNTFVAAFLGSLHESSWRQTGARGRWKRRLKIGIKIWNSPIRGIPVKQIEGKPFSDQAGRYFFSLIRSFLCDTCNHLNGSDRD